MVVLRPAQSRRDAVTTARRFNAGTGERPAARRVARSHVGVRHSGDRSSLQDAGRFAPARPGVESPGYCRPSLREGTTRAFTLIELLVVVAIIAIPAGLLLASFLAEHERKLDEALALAERAVRAQPDNPEFLDTLGWVQAQRGDLETAELTLRRALKLAGVEPPAEDILRHLGIVRGRKAAPTR